MSRPAGPDHVGALRRAEQQTPAPKVSVPLTDTHANAKHAQDRETDMTVSSKAQDPRTDGQRKHRDRTYAARRAMVRTFQELRPSDKTISECGKPRGRIEAEKRRGVVSVTGFASCKLKHLCPTCSIGPRMRRRLEIALAVHRWMEQGKLVVMATFALPHTPLEPLDVLLERLWDTWKYGVHDSARGRAWKAKNGVAHMVRATEVTFHRSRGRHPHMHVLLFLDAPANAADGMPYDWAESYYRDQVKSIIVSLLIRYRDRWGAVLNPDAALEMEVVRDPWAADYLTKMAGEYSEQGVDREMIAMGAQKDGRNGSIGAMEIPYALAELGGTARNVAALVTGGDAHAVWLARCMIEYREATFDRTMIGFSKGLRPALLPDIPDMSDEQLARTAGRMRGEYREAVKAGKIAGSIDGASIDIPVDAGPERPASDEDDGEPLAVSVEAPIYSSWARKQGDQYLPADAMFCRRWESAGLWRLILDMAVAWEKACGGHVKVLRHEKSGRLRVGTVFEEASGGWVEVDPGDWLDLAERWEPKAEQVAA